MEVGQGQNWAVAPKKKKTYNYELLDLCTPPSVIRITKFRSIILTTHVARMGDMKNANIIF
jgi:hypothetical protein